MHDDITTAMTVEERDITTTSSAAGEASAGPADAVPMTEVEAPQKEATAAEVPRPVSYVSVPPDVWALARGIAAVLGETMPPPVRTITLVVDRLGPGRARALLGQTLTSEASGGLVLPDAAAAPLAAPSCSSCAPPPTSARTTAPPSSPRPGFAHKFQSVKQSLEHRSFV